MVILLSHSFFVFNLLINNFKLFIKFKIYWPKFNLFYYIKYAIVMNNNMNNSDDGDDGDDDGDGDGDGDGE